MLLAINMNFVVFSVYLDDLLGLMFALFVLTGQVLKQHECLIFENLNQKELNYNHQYLHENE